MSINVNVNIIVIVNKCNLCWLMLINVTMLKLHKQLQSSKVVSGKPPACNCQKGVTDIRSGETDTKTNYKWMSQKMQNLEYPITVFEYLLNSANVETVGSQWPH